MPQWRNFPIAGSAYSDESRPWAHQDTVNLLIENAERPGTRSVAKMRPVPGMVAVCDLGTNAPIRGMRNVEGKLLVVSGQTLFQVLPDFSTVNLGTIPGVGRTKMSHNQITGGNEVAIPTGSGGYVYNTATSTLAQITDDGFAGAVTFDYVDSYITGVEPRGRFAFHSDLAAATSYNTLDRYEAEGSPDKIVGQIVTHREWWLCGERTIEPYVDTGATVGTFQRQSGLVIERGVASPYCMALLDNSVFLVGDDGNVYRANGYNLERISTMPIEQALAQCNLALCFAFTFEDKGHKVYYLTCPDGYTWGYDVASRDWHRRESKGLNRWRLNDLVKWNGQWIGGDFSNGKLYRLDWSACQDDGDMLERRRTLGVIHDDQNALIINGLELVVDTGIADPIIPVTSAWANAFDAGACTVEVTDSSLGTVLFSQVLAKGQSGTFGNSTVAVSSLGVVSLTTTSASYGAILKVIPSYDISNAGIRASSITIDGTYSSFVYATSDAEIIAFMLTLSGATLNATVTPDPADLSSQPVKTQIAINASAQ